MVAFISANLTKRRWLRITVLVGTVFGLLITIAAAALVISALANTPKTEFRSVSSPDGFYEATTTYTPGFLGRDVTTVDIKRKGSLWAFKAFEYRGVNEIDTTTVKWSDNSHVEILYYSAYYGIHGYCASPPADLTVVCTPLANGR